MAAIRPFRGLRYASTAGALGSLLAPASETLSPNERDGYGVRNAHNVVHLSCPEGHGDDRSKYVRFARAAARLAEMKREGVVVVEPQPSFYRVNQRFGDDVLHTSLFAIASLDESLVAGETANARDREERLRLLEATRTAFEPAVAYFDDPDRSILDAVRAAPASSEVATSLNNVSINLEAVDEPEAVAKLRAAFEGVPLLVADGVGGYEATKAFGADGVFVALTSLSDVSYARLPLHRVIRRIPGVSGREELIARLSTRFRLEEHHNRNLVVYLDKMDATAFGLATEGGLGYLLTPLESIDEAAATWLEREVIQGLLGVREIDPELVFSDPNQAVRAVDEGAAAGFLLPRPRRTDLRFGTVLPHRVAATFPEIPTGLVFWSMGDDV